MEYLLDVLPRPVHWSLPVGHNAELPDGVERFEGVAHEGLAEARIILDGRGLRIEEMPLMVACARDPYALEVSRYAFLRQQVKSFNHGPEQAVARLGDFELFARCTRPHGGRPLEIYYTLDGAVPANLRIIKLENVAEDLPRSVRAAGLPPPPQSLPHRNRTEHGDVRGFYTPAAEEAVYQKYKWVFDAGLYRRLDLGGACVEPDPADYGARADNLVDPGRLAAMDAFGRANAWLAASEIHRHARRPEAQREALEHAIAGAGQARAERLLIRTAAEHVRCLGLGGAVPVDEGIRTLERLIGILPSGRSSGTARLALSELHAARGASDRASAICEDVRGESVELSLAASSAAGSIALLEGDARSAEANLSRRRPWNESDFAGDRGDALCRLGRHAEADRVALFTEATASTTDAIAQSRWRRTRARVAASGGDSSLALRRATEAVKIAAATQLPNVHADALLDLAEVLEKAAQADAARPLVAEAVALYERKGNIASATRAVDIATALA